MLKNTDLSKCYPLSVPFPGKSDRFSFQNVSDEEFEKYRLSLVFNGRAKYFDDDEESTKTSEKKSTKTSEEVLRK